MPLHPSSPRRRRGAHAVIGAMMITTILGFGALAIDVTWMRLTQAQAQGVADAAAQAALLELRRTGSIADARRAAAAVATLNRIGHEEAEIASLEFGTWEIDETGAGTLIPTNDSPNAVRAEVTPIDERTMPYYLAPILGFDRFSVRARATAAGRRLTLVVVQDSTHSWSQEDYGNSRGALLDLLDTLENSHGNEDRVGLVTFNWRYAYEYTPLTKVTDIAGDSSRRVRRAWGDLNVFSEAGVRSASGCREHTGRRKNDFNAPRNGCFPANPRAYYDEWGTDHTTGLSMAKQMFAENDDPMSYNALLVLTDGKPNYLLAGDGDRQRAGYTETRWREYAGPVPRTGDEIRFGSIALTEEMWEEQQVHTWVVSFTASDWAMEAMPRGQGYYTLTQDSRALSPIVQAIADAIPLTLVE